MVHFSCIGLAQPRMRCKKIHDRCTRLWSYHFFWYWGGCPEKNPLKHEYFFFSWSARFWDRTQEGENLSNKFWAVTCSLLTFPSSTSLQETPVEDMTWSKHCSKSKCHAKAHVQIWSIEALGTGISDLKALSKIPSPPKKIVLPTCDNTVWQ